MNKTSFDVKNLVRQNILRMKPYSSARDEFKGEAEVFLDANENPYPSPYNRYPDPLQWKIKEKLAVIKNTRPERIFLGNGSDEPIDLVIRAFCNPGKDSILITGPTYGMYAVCAEVNDAAIKTVLLTPGYDLDIDATLNAVDESVKVIFLCSPNNPTAALLSREKIIEVIQNFSGIVVVDEAYIDFAGTKSFIEDLDEFPNLMVLQTFSKAWGLAGLRCGMAYASEDIVRILNKIKYPYNINTQTQELVLDALNRENQKNEWVREILAQREMFTNELNRLPLVQKVFTSDANFVLARVTNARNVYEYLMNNRIIVRDRSKVTLCEDCLRITIGTPDENTKLLAALRNYK